MSETKQRDVAAARAARKWLMDMGGENELTPRLAALIAAEYAPDMTMLKRYKQALEGLTPGGSEFVDDPERCAAFVQESRDALIRTLLRKVRGK